MEATTFKDNNKEEEDLRTGVLSEKKKWKE